MTELQATLDAIEELAVQQCGYCSAPLADDGESPDFCGDECQRGWIADRNEVVELIGYREPSDLAAHFSNQVELYSPEVRPAVEMFGCSCGRCTTDRVLTFNLTIDDSRFREAISGMWEQLYSTYYQQMLGRLDTWQPIGLSPVDGVRANWTIVNETGWFSLRPAGTESEPAAVGEPFDPDYEYDWPPIPALHAEEPALPVVAAHGHDWQALVDSARQRVSFAPSPDPARRNRRTR